MHGVRFAAMRGAVEGNRLPWVGCEIFPVTFLLEEPIPF
jgi:hypothetical protein